MQAAVNGLRVNFYNAVSPRVTKLYSSEHHEEMMDLVFMSSKLAFFFDYVFFYSHANRNSLYTTLMVRNSS